MTAIKTNAVQRLREVAKYEETAKDLSKGLQRAFLQDLQKNSAFFADWRINNWYQLIPPGGKRIKLAPIINALAKLGWTKVTPYGGMYLMTKADGTWLLSASIGCVSVISDTGKRDIPHQEMRQLIGLIKESLPGCAVSAFRLKADGPKAIFEEDGVDITVKSDVPNAKALLTKCIKTVFKDQSSKWFVGTLKPGVFLLQFDEPMDIRTVK
jgi:hypothetical protein